MRLGTNIWSDLLYTAGGTVYTHLQISNSDEPTARKRKERVEKQFNGKPPKRERAILKNLPFTYTAWPLIC